MNDRLARILEKRYLEYLKSEGFPDFDGLSCGVSAVESPQDHLRILTYRCVDAEGTTYDDRVMVGLSEKKGWVVLGGAYSPQYE